MSFEENEISKKSAGGTELVKRALARELPPDLTDHFQIICSRVRDIHEDKIRIYWLHDLPDDPETSHLKEQKSRDRFHQLVFCGNWQQNQYYNKLGLVPDEKFQVLDNPVRPFDARVESTKKQSDTIRLIYTSTPQRGLALLVPVFVELAKKYPNIHLDVFSSFSIYGWNERDEPFESLFNICREHPQITYHGAQPNEVVRQALSSADIFAYPSIWPECNSCALIEAMSAGLVCVHPNFAGLSDTSGGLTHQYQWIADPQKHANMFYTHLNHAIQSVVDNNHYDYVKFVKNYADTRFNIKNITMQWHSMLSTLLQQYPTVESRQIPKNLFIYKT